MEHHCITDLHGDKGMVRFPQFTLLKGSHVFDTSENKSGYLQELELRVELQVWNTSHRVGSGARSPCP